MDDPKQHVIDTLKEANNILVTVKASPTVDQLAACIALTLVLNELGKHGTAVFSGQIPSVLDFLEPDKTIEKNTDSLQDFIISLDKAKADKLRYKIEDTVVKIFITPYRTSLSSADLNFEPGDFNVDVVVALGVHNQDDIDTAITEHGKILHDATVLSVNTQGGSSEDLGSVAWIDEKASSLSEMVAEIVNSLGKDDALDNQVATALLTGIVAETERFGNARTTPQTLKVAAKLLTAGANQELVAAKLSAPEPKPKSEPEPELEPVRERYEAPSEAEDEDSHEDASLPQLDEPVGEKHQVEPGTLEIDHPITPLSAFDTSNDAFQLPEPQTPAPVATPEPEMPQAPEVSEAPDPAARAMDDAAMTQDITSLLNQPSGGQEQNADVPSAAPEAQSRPQEGENDDQATLDFLKDRKVESHPRAFLEPLPEQKIEQIRPGGELPDIKSASELRDDLHLAPPSLGGTLTANLPNERQANSLERDSNRQAAAAPILSHETPSGSFITSLISEEDQQKSADSHGPTLAEIEQQVHAHDVPALAVSQEPATGERLIDSLIHDPTPSEGQAVQTVTMPAPTAIQPTVSLPAPATANAPAAPASPPPPVPPPLAPAA